METECMFEYIDDTMNLTQKFSVGPRFYISVNDYGNGDGVYEFLPKYQ
jgi:hypothetical protein